MQYEIEVEWPSQLVWPLGAETKITALCSWKGADYKGVTVSNQGNNSNEC